MAHTTFPLVVVCHLRLISSNWHFPFAIAGQRLIGIIAQLVAHRIGKLQRVEISCLGNK